MRANDIMHPEDAKAISVLKKIPLRDSIFREVLEFAEENIYRGENLAMMVRVTPSCMPDLYSDMTKVVNKVGIAMPDLYVYNDPVMNAFTFGETRPFVCVSSSVIEKMTREEVKAILAHECGHILCQHVLYNSVVHTLEELGQNLGAIHYSLTGPMHLALCYWSRRSEFSADRCAAAVVGEKVFQSSMLKLTSGLADIGTDPYQLVRQAKEYHAHERKSVWSFIQQNCRMAFYSHPQMVNRAYEIDRWKNSYNYKSLTRNLYEKEIS